MSEDEEQVAASPEYCRHCGAVKNVASETNPITLAQRVMADGDDWLCAECERWQDQTICPTCHQVARISLMPEEMAPKVARPKKS